MALRPKQDNVLVLFDLHRDADKDVVTHGGILIPHAARKPRATEPVLATVIAAGPGAYQDEIRHDEGMPGAPAAKTSRRYISMDPGIVPGARVLVDSLHAGDIYEIDRVEHRIVRAGNVVGIVEGE